MDAWYREIGWIMMMMSYVQAGYNIRELVRYAGELSWIWEIGLYNF